MNALTKTNLLIEYLDNTEVTYLPNARIVAVSSVEESNPLTQLQRCGKRSGAFFRSSSLFQ